VSNYVASMEGSVCTAEVKYICPAVHPDSLNLIEVNVIGVYENVAVSCRHVSASEKLTRQESSSATTQTITTFT